MGAALPRAWMRVRPGPSARSLPWTNSGSPGEALISVPLAHGSCTASVLELPPGSVGLSLGEIAGGGAA